MRYRSLQNRKAAFVSSASEPEVGPGQPSLLDRRSDCDECEAGAYPERNQKGEGHSASTRPSPWRLLRIWIGIGAQSFGGGAATLYLIRRAAVEEHGWVSDEEFTRFWAICQVAPGINILGMVILIGWRLAGAIGVALALAGLLLPSASITVLLTAVYASIKDLPVVQAALRGVVPATVGLGLLLAYRMALPPLDASRREGRASLALSYILCLGSAMLVGLVQAPVIAVLWGMGVICAVAQWQRRRHSEQTP
jgi:chromate transporter